MGGSASELYIYWRTPRARWPEAAAALARWQAAFCATVPGLRARWLRRIGEDPGDVTLMEIWTHPDGIDAATAGRITVEGDAALEPWLSGQRHVEAFVSG